MSLRARIALAAGVAVALAVVGVVAAAYAGSRSHLLGQVDNSLRSIATQWQDRAQHRQGPPGGGPRGPGTGLGGFRGGAFAGGGDCDRGLGINGPPGQPFGGANGVVQLVTPNGSVCRSPSATTIPVDPRARHLADAGHGSYFAGTSVQHHHLRVLVSALPGFGALMVALPLTDVDHTLHDQLLFLIAIGAGGIVLAALLGLVVARTALRPIARFTRQTERIAAQPERLEHERVAASGRDELARLARTFNQTLDALDHSVQAQRNLVADASHELRTPIASLRANLQLLRDERLLPGSERDALREDMIEELDELTALVSDVVELARGGKPTGEPADVRLDEVVAGIAERTRRRAPELEVHTELEPTLVRAEGERIARAVSNLLDNARKWSPPGGVIEVTLRDGVLSVRDHGPGFKQEDLPFVFDRFHRARDARAKPGSGLGLAIVRQAAEAHGGFAEAANAPGGGALVRVSFGDASASEPLQKSLTAAGDE